MTITHISAASATAPATPTDAAAFFAARLAFQADVSDVRAALETGAPGFVLVDSRGEAAWSQGRVPGALHLPTAEITERAAHLVDPAVPVITYCWGPGCDGATRAALAFARLGYRVREMIGGIEYWTREGFPVEGPNGVVQRAADPLTAPVGSAHCAC
ncbi:rhodanese-like domain-containing protein [Streptomyces buecherae]|uniref:Rhodanese-like domain-containing protein n=1 Tax=Streptomyces buecherae TaxID=2763006 RepID=A0A7H8NFA4_9ACTN|nr:rhodanese-like domain-containing protein [Streptomyces buecherae]QKW53153.1 rhodanese-like domain-containing protein [Streptomyces buecherae]